jgi:hypothetical protein
MVRDKNRQEKKFAAEQERAGKKTGREDKIGGAGWMDPGNLIDQIGHPNLEGILMAATVAASIPENIRQSAQSAEWAPEVLFYT